MRVRLRAYGRVQGVGFREHVRRAALELELSGWVRNCADGSVEVEAEGPAERLEALGEAVRAGPRWAEVSRVERLEAGGEELGKGFRVRR